MTNFESRLKRTNISWLVGIDEVGRGPLAGPVSVCACVIPYVQNKKKTYSSFISKYKQEINKLRLTNILGKDSKKLKESDRIEWKNFLQKTQAQFFYGFMSAQDIDSKGIAVCIRKLIEKNLKTINPKDSLVLLDGGLKAPEEYMQETIIKGDEKEMVISFASIYAKVTRDEYMKKISKKFLGYGFEVHKGYGTFKHRNAIKKRGVTKIHRRSFLKNILN
jgi:ribonuclease HII